MSTDEKRHFRGDRPPLPNAELLLLPIAYGDRRELAALARDLSTRTFDLDHCDDPHCVMSLSNSLLEADRKSSRFCNICRGRPNSRRYQ